MSHEKIIALSIRDAGAALGVGRTKVYQLIASGELDARALGGRTIVTASSIERLVAGLPPAPVRRRK